MIITSALTQTTTKANIFSHNTLRSHSVQDVLAKIPTEMFIFMEYVAKRSGKLSKC